MIRPRKSPVSVYVVMVRWGTWLTQSCCNQAMQLQSIPLCTSWMMKAKAAAGPAPASGGWITPPQPIPSSAPSKQDERPSHNHCSKHSIIVLLGRNTSIITGLCKVGGGGNDITVPVGVGTVINYWWALLLVESLTTGMVNFLWNFIKQQAVWTYRIPVMSRRFVIASCDKEAGTVWNTPNLQ